MDGRRFLLRLTDEGLRTHKKLTVRTARMNQVFLAPLSAEEQTRFCGMTASHSIIHSRILTGYTDWTPEARAALPAVDRPLVRDHEETGRTALLIASHIEKLTGRKLTVVSSNASSEPVSAGEEPAVATMNGSAPGEPLPTTPGQVALCSLGNVLAMTLHQGKCCL